ncbi:carboxyl-terminal processing protease CtpC [Thermosynechococcus sp. M55_K2018_012]|uniref:carboxyl-terminal processing protease CtpC n=1 Tax=Thermosynechococcus sp. M55_K2018_012 TaxID=2747809 RepID=UPI001A0B413C|nr:carboxyl-terminal processing protease CtpC [Thermosynechococcus sp. M55_K2018_012]HIK48183.1 PDZ domain-containing protein [Thermosynechococcus sp. M55_K2018_012]
MGITHRTLVVSTTVVMTALVAVTGAGLHWSRSLAGFRQSPKELVDEVWQVIDREYVDATFNGNDWRAVRREFLSRNYTKPEDAYKAAREMLEKLNDPYTRFMDPEQFRSMQIETSGELTGVGITITQDEKTKEITVVSPIEGSPAAEMGLMAKDVILKIDGKSTKGMDLNQAVSMIRGPVNTKVRLTIQRGDQILNYEITRARIEIHPVRFSLRQTPQGPVGYIRLVTFSSNAAAEMRTAIRELEKQGAEGYVLDLRSNPGGLLFASAEIARMFLPQGDIVSTVNRQGEAERLRAGRGFLTNKPLVVLIDGGSASASEILAGALQDNGRAVLVGTRTFGKGLVQSVQPVGEGAGIAVTIAKYFTPRGRDINKKGIEPDIEVTLTEQQRGQLTRDDIATDRDPQFTRALAVLKERILAERRNTQSARPPRTANP